MMHIASSREEREQDLTGEEGNGDVAADPGGDVAAEPDEVAEESGADVRSRASRRITRLEERLGQTRVQLDRAKGRRDELEHLLQRMVDAESSRRDQLKAREADIERREAQLESMREELEQRAERAQQEQSRARETLADRERREEAARAEAESLRARLSELEGRSEEAFQAVGQELREAKSQAEHEREQRQRLDAQLAEQRDLARDASRQLVAAVEQREELEAAHRAIQVEAEEAAVQAADAGRRLAELERENERLRAEVEQAEARSAEEREWHSQLEARLSGTEKQAESVLRDLDEELEIALGRVALERERRAAAETRLAELEEVGAQSEGAEVGAQSEGAEAGAQAAHGDQLQALVDAEREIERLRADLEDARSAGAEAPEEAAPAADVETLRAELEEARAEADALRESQEHSRRRILQLEELVGEPPFVIDADEPRPGPLGSEAGEAEPAEGEEADREGAPRERDTAEQQRRLLGSRRGAERQARAPLKDPSELPGMSDEQLAQTFSAMREAAKLADARGDRDSAQSHRTLARAVAEEAASRPDFGETKVRGRKRNRALRELAAAREKALELRPLMARSDQEDQTPAG